MIFTKRITALLLALTLCFSLAPMFASAATVQSGTFTAVAMNVDGLPQKILFVNLNSDGPGSDGTKAISQKIATYGWDIIGVSEDFNFNTELMSALSGSYNAGTYRGKVSGLTNDTDGLNLIWKNRITVSGESWVGWEEKYSSGIFNTGNGADHMIDKGYRFYQATIAEGVTVDFYILHMDAASDQEDIDAREAELGQLVKAIKASNNHNPIIVMGDTNCRYTREHLETLFIDEINADARFTVKDCWIEECLDGVYPVYGTDSLMVGDLGYVKGEIVDKMFFINNTDSDVTLTLNNFRVATDFTDANGAALADHFPIVGEFGYTKGVAHEHSYTSAVTKEPTCTATGVTAFTCDCGESYTEDVPALGHNYESAVTEPNCTDEGYTTHTCTRCGNSYVDTKVPAKGHSYTAAVTQAATCTDPGVKTFTCSCGESYTEAIAALGHDYRATVTAPTCTAEGYTTQTCARCGDSYTDARVPAKGHSFAEGVCTDCGAIDPNYVASHKHEYTETLTQAATCTDKGIKTFTCACGESYTEEISALGHAYSAQVTAPTCTTEGYTTHTCSRCGDSYADTTVAPLGHSFVDGICSLCGAADPGYVPPHEHTYTEAVTKGATCTEKGVKTFTCECGESYTEEISALGHDYSAQVTAPTCTAEGYTTHTCGRCGDSYTDSKTPATGHSYTGNVTKDATCTAEGVKTFTCHCGERYTESIPALGHAYSSVVTAPTCTAAGYTTHTCGYCGNSYTDSNVASLGHSYENGKCTACGAQDPDYMAPAGGPTMGAETSDIQDGKYVIAFHTTTDKFSMVNNNGTIDYAALGQVGDAVTEDVVWNVEKTDKGYLIYTEIDGEVRYLARSSRFSGGGYKLQLQSNAFRWSLTDNGTKTGVRFYTTTLLGRRYYLRYYNSRYGWLATTTTGGLHLYPVNE